MAQDLGRSSTESQLDRIAFELECDEDDYPPADHETLWVRRTENGFVVDNAPFFVRGISAGDVVRAELRDGEWRYVETVSHSDHTTLRLWVVDAEDVPTVHKELISLGCYTEQSHLSGLLSVDVPPEVPAETMKVYLRVGVQAGRFDFEEAAIRWPGGPDYGTTASENT